MKTWRCTIDWDIEAATPQEAARLAWEAVIESTGPIVGVRPAPWEDPADEVEVDLYQELGP